MNKATSIGLMAGLALTLCSHTVGNTEMLNANSWAIRIGEKNLLASWMNNEMGDTAVVEKSDIRETDTLFAERYLCGLNRMGAITTLTIKNQRNETVRETINRDNGFSFTAKMAFSDVLESPHQRDGEVLTVYFTIKSDRKEINETVLLGRLRVR